MSIAEHTASEDLDDRYGRTPQATRRKRLFFIVAVGAFAVVFGAWLLWAGLFATGAQFQTRDTGYSNVTDNSIDVHFALTVDSGTEIRCAVQAMNSSFSVIGWKIIDIPASSSNTRNLVETVRTSEKPVTGLIHHCWLA